MSNVRLSYENRVVLILTLVGSVAALDIGVFNYLSPFIATGLHLSAGQIGFVIAASQATWSIGALVTALWSDRIGKRRIFLVGAMLGFAAISAITSFSISFLTLIAARSIMGLIEGPVVPMLNTVMHAESQPRRRGMNMGIAQNFGAQILAGTIGPVLLVAMATRYGWRHAFLVTAGPALVMAWVVQRFLREPPLLAPTGRDETLWRTVKAVASVRNVQMCFLIGTCGTGWWATMLAFISLWLVRQMHFTPGAMGLAMASLGPSGAIAAVLVPGLSDRVGRRPAVVVCSLIGIVAPLALLEGPVAMVPVIAALFFGFLFTGIFPLFLGIIPTESVDARHGATALAIVLASGQIAGSLVGPFLGGVLADRVGAGAPFWLAMVLAGGAALAGLFLLETAPAKTRPETRVAGRGPAA